MGRKNTSARSGRDCRSVDGRRAHEHRGVDGEADLTIIAQKRQVELSLRARETSAAHLDYARRRLEAGAGTRLNEVRAGQEVSTNDARVENAQLGVRRAQEALGVSIAANGPVDAASEPVFNIPDGPPEAEAGWMALRPDLRLFAAETPQDSALARNPATTMATEQ